MFSLADWELFCCVGLQTEGTAGWWGLSDSPWQDSGRRQEPQLTASLARMAPVVNLRPGPSLMQATRPPPTDTVAGTELWLRAVRKLLMLSIFFTLPLSCRLFMTRGPELGSSHSMSVSTERQILSPEPGATLSLTVCQAPSDREEPTCSVLVRPPAVTASSSWPEFKERLSEVWRSPWLRRRPEWQERKEKPRRWPGWRGRREEREREEEPRVSRASDWLEEGRGRLGALTVLSLWRTGSSRLSSNAAILSLVSSEPATTLAVTRGQSDKPTLSRHLTVFVIFIKMTVYCLTPHC